MTDNRPKRTDASKLTGHRRDVAHLAREVNSGTRRGCFGKLTILWFLGVIFVGITATVQLAHWMFG